MSLKDKTQSLFAENLATLPPTLFRRLAALT
jgi:hypothetical protein